MGSRCQAHGHLMRQGHAGLRALRLLNGFFGIGRSHPLLRVNRQLCFPHTTCQGQPEWEPLPDSRPSLPYVLVAVVTAAATAIVALALITAVLA